MKAGEPVMTVWIVLTDDWELRGNGTGRVEDLQQRSAIRLMDLYEGFGIRSSFNVEVLQQLAFERHADRSEAIRRGRDAWIASLQSMLQRGFDVQLHVHPQWLDAEPVDGWWRLGRRWHIADYGGDEISRMLDDALAYLRPLVAPREIVSFRGGSWGLGPPSRATLAALAERGIKIDISIVNGTFYDGEAIKLDYRRLEQPFFPYYPDIDDVRRVAASPARRASVIEIPTQTVPRVQLIRRLASDLVTGERQPALRSIVQLAKNANIPMRGTGIMAYLMRTAAERRVSDGLPAFVMRDPFGFQSGKARSDVILDLSSSYLPLVFKRAVDICIERAQARPGLTVLVFENHTKDLQHDADFERVQTVIEHIRSKHPAVEFHTLAEVAQQADRLL
jgi:hypothetical protein